MRQSEFGMNARSGMRAFIVLCGITAAASQCTALDQAPAKGDSPTLNDERKDKLVQIAEAILARIDRARDLKDDIKNSKVSERKAEAEQKQAALTVDVAEISATEYRKGTYPSDLQTADGELALAISDLERAKDRKDWSDRMLQKGSISEVQNKTDGQALEKAKQTLAAAKAKREKLEKEDFPRELAELEGNVKKAKEALARKNSELAETRARLQKLEQRAKDQALAASEIKILTLIDEGGRLEEKGQSAAANLKFDEAVRLWQAEHAQREQRDVIRRVRQAVNEFKGGVAAPK
jgi:hypothetical protein